LKGSRSQAGPKRPIGETSGVEGIDVELLDGDGNVVAQTSTNADGKYSFDSITDAGAYQVQIATSDAWMVLGEDRIDVLLSAANENVRRINFHVRLT
tara:strand:+ start:1269 stop:1559 length:291 start_codon:yes stop_codon:yes gene_type:complete